MKRQFKQRLATLITVVLIASSLGTVTFAEVTNGLLGGGINKFTASGSETDAADDEEIKVPEETEDDKNQDVEEDIEAPEVITPPMSKMLAEEPREASTSEIKYMAPNKPVWMIGENAPGGKDRPGWGTWTDELTEEEIAKVYTTYVNMYRDGERLNGGNMDDYITKEDFRFWFEEPGEYQFQCIYLMSEDEDMDDGDWSELSEPYVYEEIGKQAPTPTGLRWEDDGIMTWDDALKGVNDYKAYEDENEWGRYYKVNVYKQKEDGTFDYDQPFDWGMTGETYIERLARDKYNDPNATYVFTVSTIGDLVNYDYSNESLPSQPLYVGEASKEATGTLDALLGDGDIKNAIENAALSQSERDVMKLAVQTDKSVEDKLKELEEKYRVAAGKEKLEVKSDSPLVAAEKVSITGGTLNGAADISFQSAEINDTQLKYKKVIGLDISLSGENVGGELNFPVVITMPVPSGIYANKLVIVHYKSSGDKEYIYPAINGDGTISFAVTSFSEFAFVDTSDGTEEKPNNNGSSSGGSGSSGGSSRTTTSAGTPGTWIQDQNGWWFQKIGGSYPVSDWLMTTDGSWFRFDEKGYMMAGWFTDQAGNRFYLNPISDGTRGTMKTGWQTIDGKMYYFNPVSDGTKGAMKTGLQLIDGNWYYFSVVQNETNGVLLMNTMTPAGYMAGADGKLVVQ